ncbi:MAG: hypothetical protein SangKO_003790 [Sandaracinaceae bacterium]
MASRMNNEYRYLALIFVWVTLLPACATEVSSSTEPIVGGTNATVGDWDSVVLLTYQNAPQPPFWCGGTVVSDRWVLTAAHCFDQSTDPSDYQVIVGRYDQSTSVGTVVGVKTIVRHPTYTPTSGNDVAVIEVESDLAVAPSRLASPSRYFEVANAVYPGSGNAPVDIVGWGNTSESGSPSNILQQAQVELLWRGAECSDNTSYTSVSSAEVCIGVTAGGTDSCQGDSGGPAFITHDGERFVVGVVSWGIGCARANLPGVYAYAPAVLDWVDDNTVGGRPSHLTAAQLTSIL